jgi:hypothetical protein
VRLTAYAKQSLQPLATNCDCRPRTSRICWSSLLCKAESYHGLLLVKRETFDAWPSGIMHHIECNLVRQVLNCAEPHAGPHRRYQFYAVASLLANTTIDRKWMVGFCLKCDKAKIRQEENAKNFTYWTRIEGYTKAIKQFKFSHLLMYSISMSLKLTSYHLQGGSLDNYRNSKHIRLC